MEVSQKRSSIRVATRTLPCCASCLVYLSNVWSYLWQAERCTLSRTTHSIQMRSLQSWRCKLLWMQTASASETSVNFYQTTRCNIPEEVIFIYAAVSTWNLTIKYAVWRNNLRIVRSFWEEWGRLWTSESRFGPAFLSSKHWNCYGP
jgi:hypothetical protein